MKRIVLLNPPGKKSYFRDYYCAKVAKASYYYHPIDFVFLSGILSEKYDVSIVDAIAGKYSDDKCLGKIKVASPQCVIALVSGPSFIEDMEFLKEMKTIINCTLVCCGDIFRDCGRDVIEKYSFIDAVLLDFSTSHIIRFLDCADGNEISNIIYRYSGNIVNGEECHEVGGFDIPTPQHSLFNSKDYIFPFARHLKFASIMTDFGCPYACDFCPVGSLKYKIRPVDSVLEEMAQISKLGIKELYVRDQTFGASKPRTMQLLDEMIAWEFNFSWTCLSRIDVLDEEMLCKMKSAGCHTIMIGVESSNREILDKCGKGTGKCNVRERIGLIKSFGFDINGFFMIGFPGETIESVVNTVQYALSLPIDYVSFNMVAPRHGTELRRSCIGNNVYNVGMKETESTLDATEWIGSSVSGDDLNKIKKKAVRSFYLRPRFLVKRVLEIKSFEQLLIYAKMGISLLRNNL